MREITAKKGRDRSSEEMGGMLKETCEESRLSDLGTLAWSRDDLNESASALSQGFASTCALAITATTRTPIMDE